MSHAAAAAFAGAVAFAAFHAVERVTGLPGTVAASGISAILAYPAAGLVLRLLGGGSRPFPQPVFDIVEIASTQVQELLLTEDDRLQLHADADPLELDDILVEIAPDSRVVQLFDPSAMVTPGQLMARIDRHLDGGTSHSPPPDASEALFEALADLRRSLR